MKAPRVEPTTAHHIRSELISAFATGGVGRIAGEDLSGLEMPKTEVFETTAKEDGNKVQGTVIRPEGAQESAMQSRTHRKSKFKRTRIVAVLLAAAACGAYYGHEYWTVGRFIESTDDAYVKVDYTTVAPKVAGYIRQVLVDDNQTVKAGQVLARIDDRDFQAALRQARADVKAADAAITNIDAQIDLQQSVIGQAKASIDASEAALAYARSEADRNARLITAGTGSQSKAEETRSQMQQASADLERDQAALEAAQNKVPVLRTQREVFGKIVESGGFSAAARRLNMSVTMVATHVQSLEERIGVRLLNRTTRKVSLTETGRFYYNRSAQILADLDEADREAGALTTSPRGVLKLYLTTAVVRFMLPVVDEFLRLYPRSR